MITDYLKLFLAIIWLLLWVKYIDALPHELAHAIALVKLGDLPIVTIKTSRFEHYSKLFEKLFGVYVFFVPKNKVETISNKTYSVCNFADYTPKEVQKVARAGIITTYTNLLFYCVVVLLFAMTSPIKLKGIYVFLLVSIIALFIYIPFAERKNSNSDFGISKNPKPFMQDQSTKNEYGDLLTALGLGIVDLEKEA